MISYPLALEGIEESIETVSPNWLARAELETSHLRYATRNVNSNPPPLWSLIKSVYMSRQHYKCAYCETKLEGKLLGRIQWDLEHFRPKGRVLKWNGPVDAPRYPFDTGPPSERGYYLLTYHPKNYIAVCKTCNSPCKGSYFPIAGARRITDRPNPEDWADEQPYLVYPLGLSEWAPEDLISYIGALAKPRYEEITHSAYYRKARVMIDLLDLNRDGLVEKRAEWLVQTVWPTIVGATADNVCKQNLRILQITRSEYTSCTAEFLKLFALDPSRAKAMVDELQTSITIS